MFERRHVTIAGRIEHDGRFGRRKTWNIDVLDLSVDGVQFVVTDRCRVDRLDGPSIVLFGETSMLRIVRYVPTNGRWMVGAQFVDPSAALIRAIHDVLQPSNEIRQRSTTWTGQ